MEKFTNELGNEIAIEVTKKVISDIEGVLISIEGPTSKTVNHITRMEAEVLTDQLREVLNDKAYKVH